MDATLETKVCGGPCGKEKPVTEFSLHPSRSGRQHQCKSCASAYMKARYKRTDGALQKKLYRKRRERLARLNREQ